MGKLFYPFVSVAAIFIAVGLWWRWASRTRQLPCPSWLAWWLTTPLTDIIAATTATLDHIGLQPGERGLDVGSGPGRLTIPAARQVGPSGEIVEQRDTVLGLAQAAGFEPTHYWRTGLAFTQNFVKPGASG